MRMVNRSTSSIATQAPSPYPFINMCNSPPSLPYLNEKLLLNTLVALKALLWLAYLSSSQGRRQIFSKLKQG